MTENVQLPESEIEKTDIVIEEAWRLLINGFISNRFNITKEAPFQFQFARIIDQLGHLYSTKSNEVFHTDLESKIEIPNMKKIFIDITCGFNTSQQTAIELKFKTKVQGAQDHARIDCYSDIQRLEQLKSKGLFQNGYFFMITDSTSYINKSRRGVGTVFSMNNGHKSPKNRELHYNSKGRENIRITLDQEYTFNWINIDKWYFLMLKI